MKEQSREAVIIIVHVRGDSADKVVIAVGVNMYTAVCGGEEWRVRAYGKEGRKRKETGITSMFLD